MLGLCAGGARFYLGIYGLGKKKKKGEVLVAELLLLYNGVLKDCEVRAMSRKNKKKKQGKAKKEEQYQILLQEIDEEFPFIYDAQTDGLKIEAGTYEFLVDKGQPTEFWQIQYNEHKHDVNVYCRLVGPAFILKNATALCWTYPFVQFQIFNVELSCLYTPLQTTGKVYKGYCECLVELESLLGDKLYLHIENGYLMLIDETHKKTELCEEKRLCNYPNPSQLEFYMKCLHAVQDFVLEHMV
jgi:hypothetical protein